MLAGNLGNLAYLRGDMGRQNEAEEASLESLEILRAPPAASFCFTFLCLRRGLRSRAISIRALETEGCRGGLPGGARPSPQADGGRLFALSARSRRDAQRPRTSLPDDPTRRRRGKMFAEALEMFQALAQEKPAVYLPDLAEALGQMGLLMCTPDDWKLRKRATVKPTRFSRNCRGKIRQGTKARWHGCSYSWGSYTPKPVLPKLSRQLPKASSVTANWRIATPQNSPGGGHGPRTGGEVRHISQRLTEAESAYDEALKIRRKLAKENPLVRMELAGVLTRVGVLYAATLRRNEAERAYNEALAIRRQLDPSHSGLLEGLADTLHNLGVLLYELGRWNVSEKALREALEIRRKLAEVNPAVNVPHLAATLKSAGTLYRDTQRPDDADKAFAEAEEILRKTAKPLASSRP